MCLGNRARASSWGSILPGQRGLWSFEDGWAAELPALRRKAREGLGFHWDGATSCHCPLTRGFLIKGCPGLSQAVLLIHFSLHSVPTGGKLYLISGPKLGLGWGVSRVSAWRPLMLGDF